MTVFQKIKQKNRNRKGFTLAELLIVVAIIGVLVAISIPIFTTQLKKAQRAVSEANLRSLYSELVADYIDDGHYSIKLDGYVTDGLSPTRQKATIIVHHDDPGSEYDESFIIYNVNFHSFPRDGKFKDGVEPSFYVYFNDGLDPEKRSYPGTNDTGDDSEDDEDDEDDEEDDE